MRADRRRDRRASEAFVAGEYDLAGFAVGVVEKSRAIDGRSDRRRRRAARPRLERAAFERLFADPQHPRARGAPTSRSRSPASPASARSARRCSSRRASTSSRCWRCWPSATVKGMAHITGGGLDREHAPHVPRRRSPRASTRDRWPRPPIFDWLQRARQRRRRPRCIACSIAASAWCWSSRPRQPTRRSRGSSASGETVYAIGTVVPRAADAPGTVVA